MLTIAFLLFAILMACLVPFVVSVALARLDFNRGRYRLTHRVSTVAAFLTVAYSLTICFFRSPMSITSPDELVSWLVVIGVWDLTLMFSSSVFAVIGYLFGTRGKVAMQDSVDLPQPVIASGSVGTHETGNPYQAPKD